MLGKDFPWNLQALNATSGVKLWELFTFGGSSESWWLLEVRLGAWSSSVCCVSNDKLSKWERWLPSVLDLLALEKNGWPVLLALSSSPKNCHGMFLFSSMFISRRDGCNVVRHGFVCITLLLGFHFNSERSLITISIWLKLAGASREYRGQAFFP